MSLKWSSLELLAAIGCGWAAYAIGVLDGGIVVGGIVGGAKLVGAFSEARQKHGLQSSRHMARQRAAILRAWEFRGKEDWIFEADLEAADYLMARDLAECIPPVSELGRTVVDREPYPARAAAMIVDRLAQRHEIFRKSGEIGASETARTFAPTVVEASLESALSNDSYARQLIPHMLIDIGQGVGQVRESVGHVHQDVGRVLSKQDAITERVQGISAGIKEVSANIASLAESRNAGDKTIDTLLSVIRSLQHGLEEAHVNEALYRKLLESFLRELEGIGTDPILWPAHLRELASQIRKLPSALAGSHNLPAAFDEGRRTAAAALAKGEIDTAKQHINRWVAETKRSYQRLEHKVQDVGDNYARALAAAASLAFSELDYPRARDCYVAALSISTLTADRVERYRRSLTIAFNAIIARSGDYAEGRKVLAEMVAAGVTPNQITYSTLINLAKDYAEGRKVLAEMVAAGVIPDEVTYNTLIKLTKDYAEGRKVLAEMVAAGVTPNQITYSTLIDLAKDYAEGRKVLAEMVAARVIPDEVTYNTLIKLTKDYAEGRKVLAEMMTAGVTPNEITYSTLIKLTKDYVEGRKVLAEMVMVGVTPDEVPYSTLINLAKDYAEGRKVLAEMVAAGVTPGVFAYSTLIKLTKDYVEGRKVLAEMVAAGVTPNEVTYSTLINLAKDYAEGRRLLTEMEAAGIVPDEITCTAIVNTTSSYEEAWAAIDQLKGFRKKNPSEGELGILVDRIDTFEEAVEELPHLRSLGYFTGRSIYESAFSKDITHLGAGELLEIYQKLPFKFDTALSSPINQYRVAGLISEAMILMLFSPHIGSAQKLLREVYGDCINFLERRLSSGDDEDNIYYALGIAAYSNGDWELAHRYLSCALTRAYARPRIEYINRLLSSISAKNTLRPTGHAPS